MCSQITPQIFLGMRTMRRCDFFVILQILIKFAASLETIDSIAQ